MVHIPPRSRGVLQAQAESSYIARKFQLPVQRYIHTESLGGIVLLAATIVAVIWANSPWQSLYHDILKTYLALDFGILEVSLSVEKWINDGLMAIFFFVVGLEIKREILSGQLSSPRRAALPLIAAFGGMIVPAAMYMAFNWGTDGERGWGIPMATDIAFALGVLALLGRQVPMQLRVFLLGLAVVDDLGAIIVIALFYTETISFGYLAIVAGLAILMIIANRVRFTHSSVILILGFLMWVAMLKSGVHATIAGVLFGLLTSTQPQYSKESFARNSEALLLDYRRAYENGDTEHSETILGRLGELTQGTEAPLERLERLAHPWTSYAILPIFALANAGLYFSGAELGEVISSEVTIGIVIGLLAGKVIGISLFPWIASKFGIVELPPFTTWTHVIGVGFLGGIGFTVALFISRLAFTAPDFVLYAQFGIMSASILAGILGYTFLKFASRSRLSLS